MFKQILVGVLSVGLVSGSYAHHDQADEVKKSWRNLLEGVQADKTVFKCLTVLAAAPGALAALCIVISPFLNKQVQPIIDTDFAFKTLILSVIGSTIPVASWTSSAITKNQIKKLIQAYGYANDPELQPYL
jgi:hypothetical protein